MRMWPSQSSVMKRKVGSTSSLTTRQIELVALGDPRPVVHAGAAERIDAHADAGAADRIEVDDAAEIVDVGAQEIVLVRGRGAPRLRRTGCAARPSGRLRASALASASIQPVTSVSAGPPLGGLYLKPPSSGGLCDGVTTMPSASPVCASAVVDQDGVRHRRASACTRRPAAIITSTPLAASTSSALSNAGARQRMRVDADEQRPVDALRFAVLADRLGDREHVRLVEAARRTTSRDARRCRRRRAARAPRDRAAGCSRPSNQLRHIHQLRGLRGLAGQRAELRRSSSGLPRQLALALLGDPRQQLAATTSRTPRRRPRCSWVASASTSMPGLARSAPASPRRRRRPRPSRRGSRRARRRRAASSRAWC